MYCANILKQLGLKKTLELQDCDLLNEIGLETPFYEGLGFPPALIPVANSVGSFSLLGLYISDISTWKISYVDLIIEDSEIYEIGLTEAQFNLYLARRAMVDYYEEDEEDIFTKTLKLCSILNVCEPMDLEFLSDKELLKFEVFGDGIPKYLKENQPGSTYGNTGFQIVSLGQPLNSDLITSFDKELSEGNYQSAWNILNSPGWKLENAKVSFKKLVESADNELLSELYYEWIKLNHPSDGY